MCNTCIKCFFLHSEHCGGNGWGCEHYESFNGVIVFFYKTSQISKKMNIRYHRA